MKMQIEKEDDRNKEKEERIKLEQLNIRVEISYHTTFCTTISDLGLSEVNLMPQRDPLLRIKRSDFLSNRTEH